MRQQKYILNSNTTLIRKCDKSFIEHRGLTVPKKFYEFFGIQDIPLGNRRDIIFEYKEKQYDALFVREKIELARIRLFWDTSLKLEFKKFIDRCVSLPSVKFEKITEKY